MLIKFLFDTLVQSPEQFLTVLFLYILPLLVALLISITFHEWSHGFVAYLFGDNTPKLNGRLSLNPFTHLDPVGTLMLFIIGIGWAKPVPINPENIKNKTKLMLVALAGPASNFLLAILISTLLFFSVSQLGDSILIEKDSPLVLVISYVNLIIEINLILAIFNLMPIPPLDGSRILSWFLPPKLEEIYFKIAPYSIIILVILFYTLKFDFIFDTARSVKEYIFNFLEILF